MAGLEDLLGGALGGDALGKIASYLGTDASGAQKAVSTALPALLGRMKQNADTPDGAAALAAAVNNDHDGSVIDDPSAVLSGTDASGAKIVGKVFGDDADAVHAQVAQSAGIDKAKAAGLMGMLAPMVMGALGKHGQSTGGLQASGLSSLLGGLTGGSGGLGGMLSGLLGGGGNAASSLAGGAASAGGAAATGASSMVGKVTSMLDKNHDGSVVDDVQRMAKGGFVQKVLGLLKRK